MRQAVDNYGTAVAAEVRAHMGRARVSQTRLASVLDMSQAALSRRLTGETPLNINELRSIAQFFGVEVAELLPADRRGGVDLRTRSSAWTTAVDSADSGARVIPLARTTVNVDAAGRAA